MTPDQIHHRYRNIKLVAWGCIALALVSAGIGLSAERDYAEAVSVTPRTVELDKALRDLVQHPEPGPAVGMTATFYGTPEDGYIGKTMANGDPMDPEDFTAAHRTLPLGTVLDVSRIGCDSGGMRYQRTVRVTVSDRGPWDRNPDGTYAKDLDLSAAAFARLEDPRIGVIRVSVRRVIS